MNNHPGPAAGVRIVDSITKLTVQDAGCVAVAASHGGRYAGAYAASRGVAAAIFNDAGLGMDRAGIAALSYLQQLGIPAAAADHRTARIGDGADMMASGVVSYVNALAARAGCRPGMAVRCCAGRLGGQPAAAASRAGGDLAEARVILLPGSPVPVLGLDSVSLLRQDDAGAIAVTASHGGVLAASGSDGVRAPVRLASFHDAGGGKDEAGFGRLPRLQARGIAAVTVAGDSARIGDARSCYESGRISRANPCAGQLGAQVGQYLKDFIAALLARHPNPMTGDKP